MQAPEASQRLLPTLSEYGRRGWLRLEQGISLAVARPLVSLAVLAVVQWLAILVYALTVRHNGWLFYQGGDQIWLLTTGWLLGQGELGPPEVGYGWPLLLAPLTWLTGPNFVDAMPWVICFNVLVLGPLVLFALRELASRIAGAAFGLLAAVMLGRAAVRGNPAFPGRLPRALCRAVPPRRARTDRTRRLPVDGAPARRQRLSSCGRSRRARRPRRSRPDSWPASRSG